MLLQIVNLKDDVMPQAIDVPTLFFLSMDRLDEFSKSIVLPNQVMADIAKQGPSWFESYNGYDYCHLLMKNHSDEINGNVDIYFKNNLLVFIMDLPELQEELLRQLYMFDGTMELTKVLSIFFDLLTYNDISFLDAIEQQIADLEERLMKDEKKSEYMLEFVGLRKTTMEYKRYYEQLLDVLEEMLENQNGLLDRKAIKVFKRIENRINRMYLIVTNLKDAIAQVREAYQAQVDIDLNNIMKFFTVMTTIFLPLNLIVGWYGMNLQMPETQFAIVYPIVIVSSIVIAIVSFWLFKRKKWL